MEQTMKRKLNNEAIAAEISSKKPKTQPNGTKLEDLKDDCLIKIFKHFTIKDLLNIVQYNERFLIAARDVFATKFSNNLVNINREVNTALKVVNLLKYFGNEIKKLEINYDYNSWTKLERRTIEHAIIKYCQTTLLEMKFVFTDQETMTDIKTPFETVKKVCFYAASCNPLITDFGYWFPNAETLELEDMYVTSGPAMKNFPKLKNLLVCNTDKMSCIEDTIATAIVVSNPQLTTLSNTVIINRDGYLLDCLMHDAKDDWLRPKTVLLHLKLDHCLPQLKSLSLVIPREKGVGFKRGRKHSDETLNKCQFDELTDLLIDFEESTVLKGLPIFTKKLEKLSLLGSHLDHNCIPFIRNHQTLNYIKLMGELKSNNLIESLIKLLAKLPNLNELNFPFSWNVKPQHVIALLKKCKHLRKLAILFEHYGSEDDHREKIESAFNAATGINKTAWSITYAENTIKYDYERYEKRFGYSLTFEKSA